MSWGSARAISMMGNPDSLGVAMPSSSRASRTLRVLRWRSARMASPRRSFTSRPDRTVASDATGAGPEYRYGGAATFRKFLIGVGQAMNARSDEYALEHPATRTTLS